MKRFALVYFLLMLLTRDVICQRPSPDAHKNDSEENSRLNVIRERIDKSDKAWDTFIRHQYYMLDSIKQEHSMKEITETMKIMNAKNMEKEERFVNSTLTGLGVAILIFSSTIFGVWVRRKKSNKQNT